MQANRRRQQQYTQPARSARSRTTRLRHQAQRSWETRRESRTVILLQMGHGTFHFILLLIDINELFCRFSTHWKWIVMLVVLIIGLTAFAVAFSVLHKRYHRRREQQWSQSTVSHPDINTWGPGQSVHDFGVYRAAGNLKRSLSRSLSRSKGNKASNAEKGKAISGVTEVHPMPPMPAYKTERDGTGFGARQPPPRNGRFSRGGGAAMF